jgi:hypothetical protein
MSIWRRLMGGIYRALVGDRSVANDALAESPFQASDQKAEIVRLAKQILERESGLIEGTSQLNLYLGRFPDAFPHFMILFEERQLREVLPILIEVEGAMDRFSPLPGSPDRHLWSREVIEQRDRERERFETLMRPQAEEACRKILTWLSERNVTSET